VVVATLVAAGPLLAAPLLAVALVGCTSESARVAPLPSASYRTPATAGAPAIAPAGFRTALQQTRQNRPDGLVDWRAAWVLRWDPTPGAASYVVHFATSEGRGGRKRVLTTPELHVDAAAGTSSPPRIGADQAAQLTLTGSQLLVSIAAAGPSGAEGPASAWYRVGDAPANGIPVPNSASHGH
jgi:hypothetical protein